MSLIPTTVSVRESRAMPLQSGDAMEEFGNRRQCETSSCRIVLSRYNPSSRCTLHHGWSVAPAPRRRRR
jgi:hypothetical protein